MGARRSIDCRRVGFTSGYIVEKARRWLVAPGESVFSPWISRVGVSTHFPETQNIAIEEGNFSNELRAFPGVTLGNDDPGGAAMVARQRFAVPLVRYQNV